MQLEENAERNKWITNICSSRFGSVSFVRSLDPRHFWLLFCFYKFMRSDLRPYSHSAHCSIIHTCLYAGLVCICHAACTFRLWLNEWMSRADIPHYLTRMTTHTHTHVRDRNVVSVMSCNGLVRAPHRHAPPTSCHSNVFPSVRREGEARLQANSCLFSIFFSLRLSASASPFDNRILFFALTDLCAWINLLHAGELDFFLWTFESETIVWSKQNSIETRTQFLLNVMCQWENWLVCVPMNK